MNCDIEAFRLAIQEAHRLGEVPAAWHDSPNADLTPDDRRPFIEVYGMAAQCRAPGGFQTGRACAAVPPSFGLALGADPSSSSRALAGLTAQ